MSSSSPVRQYDIVIYGASGFTGHYALESFVNSDEFGRLTVAVAGRNEAKLQKTLKDVGDLTGKDLGKIPVLIADSGNEEQLAEMAKSAKVIVNVVGPYRIYGEAVVKAAVENGAHHVDISGKIPWLEMMQMKYAEQAKANNVFIVGACGFDSVPCDLGMNFLKQKFDGTLSYAEAFARMKNGPAGGTINTGTYQTIITAIWQAKNDELGKVRAAIMPEKLEESKWKTPRRSLLWFNDLLKCYCLPFMGSCKSVVQRTQYFDAAWNNAYPAAVETYLCFQSWLSAVALMLWFALFSVAVKFDFTRAILLKYPAICSFGMFSESGPTREQTKQASFEYWFMGTGWAKGAKQDEPPARHVVVRCDGPEPGYVATSRCALSCAFTILREQEKMAKQSGGVLTPAAAFKDTNIYERLASFGITFRVDPTITAKMNEQQ